MSGIIGGAGSKSGVIGTTELVYEEGTFTPVIAPGGGSMGTSSGAGRYILIGNLVYVNFHVHMSGSHSGASGLVYCSGFPFTKKTGSSRVHQQPGYYNLNIDGYPVKFRLEGNNHTGVFMEGHETDFCEPVDFNAGAEIYLCFTYEIN